MPNNGGGNTYSAVIDLAGSDPAVTIDQNITLSGLTNSEVLHIAAAVTHLSTLLANTGAIDVTGSATLNLTGAFTAPAFGSLSANGGIIKLSATLDLAGGNMQVAGTSGWQLNGGTIKNGIVNSTGGASLAASSGILDGVTLNKQTSVAVA